jgi:hypothetical protein
VACGSIGYLVAPTLFATLSSDRQTAGLLAGRLFELMGWVGSPAPLPAAVRIAACGHDRLRRWNFWLLLY